MRMKPRTRLTLLCGCLVLLPQLLASSAHAAPQGGIAEERLEPSQLLLQPIFEYERADLRVSGPEGYMVEREFGPGEEVRLAFFDDEGRALPDGRYRYSLRLTPRPENSSHVQTGLFFVHEGSGVSRAERRRRLASTRETLNQERESQLQARQRAASNSRDQEGVTIAPPSSYALSIDGDFGLGGYIYKEGKLFLHNTGDDNYGNTALGLDALASLTYTYTYVFPNRNTAVGSGALRYNTSGSENTAVGTKALYRNDDSSNTAVGSYALYYNTSGSSNVAVGNWALYNNISGFSNAAVGLGALARNISGWGNIAVGDGALDQLTDGDFNLALGLSAGSSFRGSRNIAIGHKAGKWANTGSDNIFIGSEAISFDSNTIRIGGEETGTGAGEQNRAFIAGIRDITTERSDAVTVVIDSAGQLGTISSSRRVKEEIRDMNDTSSGLLELRPVTFHYRQESDTGQKPLRYGLIAEEVVELYPELVALDEDGEPETVLYRLLIPMLLNELQKQARLNEEQIAEIDILKAQLASLQQRLIELVGVLRDEDVVMAGGP